MPVRRSRRSSVERCSQAKAKNLSFWTPVGEVHRPTTLLAPALLSDFSSPCYPERNEGSHAWFWTTQAKSCDLGSWARSLPPSLKLRRGRRSARDDIRCREWHFEQRPCLLIGSKFLPKLGAADAVASVFGEKNLCPKADRMVETGDVAAT